MFAINPSLAINALLVRINGNTLNVVLFKKNIVTFLINCSLLNEFDGLNIFLSR